MADLLEKMPADEVADILDNLEEDKAIKLLDEMEKDLLRKSANCLNTLIKL